MDTYLDDDMTVRDHDPPLVKVTREIPLPWLLAVLFAGFGQAGLMWFQQNRQQELLQDQKIAIERQTEQLQKLSVEIGAKNLKDVEHDLKLADLERRMGQVERPRGK